MRTNLALGNLIKAKRTELGLSLAELSKLAFGNVHDAKAISLIERGVTENNKFVTVEKILFALGYDLKSLFLSELAQIKKGKTKIKSYEQL